MKPPISVRPLRNVLAGAALLLFATGCTAYLQPAGEGTVWVSAGPPPQRHEVRSRAPGPDFIWVSGDNRWNGAEYDWEPGHWERRPEPHARWVEGRWYHERRGWYHVEGHWQHRH